MHDTRLRGARTHNLKGVDLDVRPGEVLAITGVSGAGKSSLALDTLYAEGQRRFVESFSPYARQFLERLPRPPMDSLAPVAAGVSVDRSAPIKSSRSTVATMADLEAYLAGLFAKESVPHCPEHHVPATRVEVRDALLRVETEFGGRQVLVTAPLLVGDEEEYLSVRETLLGEGYLRVMCGDRLFELDELKPSIAAQNGRVFVVLDRLKVESKSRSRLGEAIEAGFARSRGLVTPGQVRIYDREGEKDSLQIRQGLTCPSCARELLPPRPGYFSYESPLGACENCRGFGRVMGIDLDKVIADDRLSLKEGAIRPWRGPKSEWERKQLQKFCTEQGIPFDAPWKDLTLAQKKQIFEGTGKRGRTRYWGIREWFEWLESKAYKMHVRVFLARYRSYDPCPVCEGTRLTEQSRWYKWGGLDLAEWHRLEIDDALARLDKTSCLTPHGALLHKEFSSRLSYLSRVGLGYLTLDRQARTLSGGESQRVTLTAALGTSLHNALFVLDEPTVGLHARDIAPLAELIRELASRQNAVIVLEHEPLIIRAADRVVELGKGAGERGGEIVFDGTVAEARRAKGATARALAGPRLNPEPLEAKVGSLFVRGARCHNLKGVDVEIPLGRLVGVSGPSGSGKSSLVVDVIYRTVARELGNSDVERPGEHDGISGLEQVALVELVDQSPLGRTSRGNAGTYTKAWDGIRKIFAAQPEAEALGYSASHFSFNVAGGRCETCAGEGFETVEMQFLADVSLVCPVCSGRRFKEEVLRVQYRGYDIAAVLELTIEQALRVFDSSAAIRRALAPLQALGLGYLRLGQPLSTLSGGEAQRLKLARALAAPKPNTLYVLDEPSAGLHADEIELLVDALRVLLRSGGSVLFVDHDLSLLSAADWLIELGPGGGRNGGTVVFEGTVQQLAQSATRTGLSLSEAGGALPGPEKKKTRKKAPALLSIQGAREHTLKDISVQIPHGQMTLVTGPSGSGKSTLAFDVVFAEGQRRFLETLTPYARRFLPTMPRADVDSVDGVPPSIALEQRTTRMGARSTVATVTEIAHYLRLLFAKLGTPYCPDHDEPISRIGVQELLSILRRQKGKGELRAPIVRARKGTYLDVFTSAARAGIAWAVADNVKVSTDDPPRLAKSREHDIDLVLQDNLRFSELDESQLGVALRWGQGTVRLVDSRKDQIFSTGGACPICGFAMGEIDPRYFSFNTAQGQCPTCEGTGLVPQKVTRGKKPKGEVIRRPCTACQGTRLGPFPRRVRLQNFTYPSLTALCVKEVRQAVGKFSFSGRENLIAEPILKELVRRLSFLGEVGLDYLGLDRDASTLSGGELQRLRLAAQLGADMTGALYVLDEPTIGLHPRDTSRLLHNLRRLVDTGSTVVMVEHDQDAIAAADYLIDMGPGGGTHGGRVVASGPVATLIENEASPTFMAFSEPRRTRGLRPITSEQKFVSLRGAREHNLRGDELRLPHQALSVVAGVSGSGKSTLVRQVFLPALKQKLERVSRAPGAFDALVGFEGIKRAIAVDQSPIGKTPRSVPATFLGIFDWIRKLYAKTPEAQVRGFDAARFSFNTPTGGRCTTCDGQGALSHEMSFLPDVVTTCPSCNGMRFDDRTLEVTYLGRNIGQTLALSASQASEVFAAHPKIVAPLRVLCDLGAGYITLGQGSHTLSGGEAQRLKLAEELCAGAKHEPTLYVLDEPTTGLHIKDVERLVLVLDRLVERGDTLVVIEHQPDVIASADWVVELGPDGGPDGGHIVFQGPVAELVKKKTPTASVLRQAQGRSER